VLPSMAAVVLSAVLSAGCASQTDTASLSALTQPELPDITVAATPAADLAGLYIAQEEGLFAKVGLHVTLEKIASNQAAITAQLKGQVDISAQSYVTYIADQAAGARFRILAEASTLKPGTRVVSNQFPIKGWKPVSVDHIKDGMVYTIYVYEVGKTK